MNSRTFNATGLALLLVVSLSMVSRAATATAESDAPLPGPSIDLQPGEIVQIVIDALANNDQPFADAGIETAFNFSSPTNRENTGPLDRFVTLVKGPVFGQMVKHRDSTLSQVLIEGDKALCLVQVVDRDNKTAYYAFRLGLQQQGEYAGMWLTEAVWPLQNPERDVIAL